MLVRTFRSAGQETFPWKGSTMSGQQIAAEIEGMTEFGQSLVAVAGIVLHALASTPDFFKQRSPKDDARKSPRPLPTPGTGKYR